MEVSPADLAEECEATMDTHFGGPTKEYKGRFRSLMFNLRDPKNKEFIRSVVTGQIHVSQLAHMDVKAMASAELKKKREEWNEYSKMSLMDVKSYNNYTGKEMADGLLVCPRCRSKKTEYVEVQTRSADEPTTKKCFCNNCNYRWKFC
jgi:transcription elongation factor S-II